MIKVRVVVTKRLPMGTGDKVQIMNVGCKMTTKFVHGHMDTSLPMGGCGRIRQIQAIAHPGSADVKRNIPFVSSMLKGLMPYKLDSTGHDSCVQPLLPRDSQHSERYAAPSRLSEADMEILAMGMATGMKDVLDGGVSTSARMQAAVLCRPCPVGVRAAAAVPSCALVQAKSEWSLHRDTYAPPMCFVETETGDSCGDDSVSRHGPNRDGACANGRSPSPAYDSPSYNPASPCYDCDSPQYEPGSPGYDCDSPLYEPGSPSYVGDSPLYEPGSPT